MTGVMDPSSPEHFAQLARQLVETPGVMPTLCGVVAGAVDVVPCDWAAVAVTEKISTLPARLAASNDADLAKVIGTIAVEAGSSPGIVAHEESRVVICPDLAHEEHFGPYAAAMLAQTSVRSVLSVPLVFKGTTTGVMTLYATAAHNFDAEAEARARVLAEHAVIAIEAARTQDAADNLELALLRSRTIGAAMGILMERHKLTPDGAFDLLRTASQDHNRKLADIAAELVETGTTEGL